MASVLKAQKANATKAQERKRKRNAEDMDVDEAEVVLPKKKKNKQRVLLLSSRGITHRMRHLMNDLEALLPHVKKGVSFLRPTLTHCSTCTVRFEARL
jgi:ribosome biogenesis protein BRX1